MPIYTISDLHLSFAIDKPMSIFGEEWENHVDKIKKDWINKISNNDTVLIAGDTSWALKYSDAIHDLNFIDSLPGKKIIIKGNHDYWWASITKMNVEYNTIKFIQNNSFVVENYNICGCRGWLRPIGEENTQQNIKIYNRELLRLKNSLDSIVYKDNPIIILTHYPFTYNGEDTEFTELIADYNVEKIIYGHLHGEYINKAFEGKKNGI